MTTYSSTFKTVVNEDDYYIALTDTFTKTQPASSTQNFKSERASEVLTYLGEDGEILTGIIPSSFTFTLIAQNSTQETYLNNVIADNTSTWYVILFKNEELHWWGYLNTETFSIDREYKPRYRFEAFDKLTLAGQQRFYGYQPWGRVAPTNSIFGMGWRRNQDPTTTTQIPQMGTWWDAGSPRDTTLLGIIYSCLFDTDMPNLGQVELNVVNWDVARNPATHSNVAGVDRTLENWWVSDIDYYFFNDPPNFNMNGGPRGDDNKDWRISEILEDICRLFRARLFQRDGIYHFVQWEAYQGDPSNGNMYVHTYRNDLRTSRPTGSDVIYPDYKYTTTLTSSEYTTDIDTYPRTNTHIGPGANWEYNQAADVVSCKMVDDSYYNGESTFEQGVNYSIISNGPFSNFTECVKREEEYNIKWAWGNFIYQTTSGGTTFIQTVSYRYDGTSYQLGNIPELLIQCLAEYKNGLRKNLNVTMIGDYDILNKVYLDSVYFIPTSVSSTLMFDRHEFKGVEFSSSDTNLGEIVNVNPHGQQGPYDDKISKLI